jgi:hypothetical protein
MEEEYLAIAKVADRVETAVRIGTSIIGENGACSKTA